MEIRWEWGCSYWDQGLVHGGNYRVEKGMEKWGEGWRRNFSTLDPELRHIHHCSCRPTFFLYFPFFHFLFLLTGGRRHLVNSETRRRFHAMTHLTAVATQKTATGSTANPASTSMYTERERERERERFRTRYIHIGNKRDKIFLGAESWGKFLSRKRRGREGNLSSSRKFFGYEIRKKYEYDKVIIVWLFEDLGK